MERKDYILRVRITDEQRANVKAQADRAGLTVSGVLRERLAALLAGGSDNEKKNLVAEVEP